LQEQQPDVCNPDELTDRIMDSLPDLPTEQPKPARRIRLYIASAITVAASLLLLLTLQYNNKVESPIQQSHRLSQANEIPTWQYEDELMRADACLTHQMEIKEKGERLAAYIHQQTTIDIQY
jgi:hypothetical protein